MGLIPQRVLIDQLQWTIVIGVVPNDDDDDEPDGLTSGQTCEVFIASRQCRGMQEVTFWHELVHMLFRSRDFCGHRKYTEEEAATILGPALFSFFEANCHITWKDECCAR